MDNYRVDENGFTIEDYDRQVPFSGFLPGLTGEDGIPMWAFYTNRGQAIGSLGINSKAEAIIEFTPACTEYENTALKGFRTFIKTEEGLYEPFRGNHRALRSMTVRKNSLRICEEAPEYGLKLTIDYFILPREPIGALVRKAKLENISGRSLKTAVVDGAAKIIPRGISNGQFQEMGNLFKSWTDVRNVENRAPIFAMRASTDDSSKVEEIRGGYFYCCISEGERMPFICDSEEIFGYDTSLCEPASLREKGIEGLKCDRPVVNKIPCAFTPIETELNPGMQLNWTSFLGFAASEDELNEKINEFADPGFASRKLENANELAEELTSDVRTETGTEAFDKYIEQCYLDNFLRGGYPVEVGGKVLYLYSRKHGDPERDYNFFTIDGEYYSQGNGNFRDVCQNRRNDVFFCPGLGDYNIRNFLNLIQADGYNPLEIRPATFTVRKDKLEEAVKCMLAACGPGTEDADKASCGRGTEDADKAACGRGAEDADKAACGRGTEDAKKAVCESGEERTAGPAQNIPGAELPGEETEIRKISERFEKLLSGRFKPGQLFRSISAAGLKLRVNPKELVEQILEYSDGNYEAGVGEGYWTDHWDYIMDLIENYLAVYPDKLDELMHSDGYMFYDSDLTVRERSETYTEEGGTVWQYNSSVRNALKTGEEGFCAGGTNWKKNIDGSIVNTTFAVKLFSLMLNKFALIDSYGMGIEMEGGKPGWNDAMNGLPAMFGSSMPETFELVRIINFLTASLGKGKLEIPVEIADFYEIIKEILGKYPLPSELESETGGNENTDDFKYWDLVATARENYRKTICRPFGGRTVEIDEQDVKDFCIKAKTRIDAGISKAKKLSDSEIPTYFTFEPTHWEHAEDADGRTYVKVKGFKVKTLPKFLEGPARYLAMGAEDASQIHEKVVNSDLYDKKLKMFKTSESLEKLSLQYGRIRAFTPGWLERESIFLHMEYKYLYALLKNGLYKEFYEAIKTAFIPFMDPAVYGRSILENSSFIASSENPDEKLHGRGFVARLSGSTTEVISMWIGMFIGNRAFYVGDDGSLKLKFAPALSEEFFTAQGDASWTFMGRCRIVYHNPSRRATFGSDAPKICKMRLLTTGGEQIEVNGDVLEDELATDLRDGKIVRIDVYFQK